MSKNNVSKYSSTDTSPRATLGLGDFFNKIYN